VKILRAAWNEELFRVLAGFPDLAHDDEVDARSGVLEMLNPQMKSWAFTNCIGKRPRSCVPGTNRMRTPIELPGSIEVGSPTSQRCRVDRAVPMEPHQIAPVLE
jgi:hypothetical protein